VDGGVDARFATCAFEGNDGDGIDRDEADDGEGSALVTGTETDGNADDESDADGVDVTRHG
jgi:hypothetical protein